VFLFFILVSEFWVVYNLNFDIIQFCQLKVLNFACIKVKNRGKDCAGFRANKKSRERAHCANDAGRLLAISAIASLCILLLLVQCVRRSRSSSHKSPAAHQQHRSRENFNSGESRFFWPSVHIFYCRPLLSEKMLSADYIQKPCSQSLARPHANIIMREEGLRLHTIKELPGWKTFFVWK